MVDDVPALTLRVLERIHEELSGIRAEQVKTNERLDETNMRLDRVVQEQIRHATAIVDLEAGQREVVRAVDRLVARFDNFLTGTHRDYHEAVRARLDRVESDLDALKKKVG
jgi:hypothetical protein